MGLFSKKEKSVIPEVQRPGSNSAGPRFDKNGDPLTEVRERRPGGRSAPTYNPQPTAGSYGTYGNYGNYGAAQAPPTHAPGQQQPPPPPPAQQAPGNYGYSDARSQLFSGAKPPSNATGRSFDSYADSRRGAASAGSSLQPSLGQPKPEWADGDGDEENPQGDDGREQATEEDDEVEGIKQQIRFTKQESLATTRDAIRTAREAEATASNTLTRLGEQTDRIANTELALDKAKGYNSRAADGAKEIRRLNQSIFKPNIQFNKQAKRDAQDARVLARHLDEKAEREEARRAAYDSRVRVEQGFREAEKSSRFGKKKAEEPTGRAKWEQGGRYQFEATNSDDEIEQELDNNLDEIAAITGRLKILATTAGSEIDAQNKHLDKIGTKVDNLDDKIVMNTSYLKRIKG